MPELGPETIPSVIAACQAGAAESADALKRTFDSDMTFIVGEATTWTDTSAQAILDGPGLLVEFVFGGQCVLGVLPESSGLLPTWYGAPDPTGESKLATLAQELGMLVLPEDLFADSFQAKHVANLKAAMDAASPGESIQAVPIALGAEGEDQTLWVLWPFNKPGAAYGEEKAAEPAAVAESSPKPAPPPRPEVPQHANDPSPPPSAAPSWVPSSEQAKAGRGMSSYLRSLLTIRVPVRVILAAKKVPIQRITDLAPGSVIQFRKTCDDPLELAVGECVVGTGEAVKVGDKFGIKLGAMTLPPERFLPVFRPNR